jgi:hypothetical protein
VSPAAVADLALLTIASGLGVWLGVNYLRRQRMRPGMIGGHFLVGAGSLEVMVMTMHGGPALVRVPPGVLGAVALGLTGLAMASGLLAGLIARRSRRTADLTLATHAALAMAGVAVFMAWILAA